MKKTKYQPGDKVRVRADLEEDQVYPMLDNSIPAVAVAEMCKLAGTIVTIRTASPEHGYRIIEDGFSWTDAMFEPIQPIVIYAKGSEVIALDKNTGENGVAKCSPYDTFDFYVGAELAFKRLMEHGQQEQQKEVKPKFKVGDIVVGLPKADEKYPITRSGWKGLVTSIDDSSFINVTGLGDDGVIREYIVNPDYFRKVEDKEEKNDQERIHEEEKRAEA